jgi:carbon storage regulator
MEIEKISSQISESKGSTLMLVLTRKRSEMIRIGDNIVVKVIQTGRSSVKIGIEAPLDVRVLRSELQDEKVTPEPHSAPVTAVLESPPAMHTLADRLKLRRGGFVSGFASQPVLVNP